MNQACSKLLTDLNALADGELEAPEVTRVASHLHECPACGEYVENLRRMSELHRRSSVLMLDSDARAELPTDRPAELDAQDAEALDRVDPGALLGRVLGSAAEDEWARIAQLFYQLGKAYVLEGNKRLPSESRRRVMVRVAPADIRRTQHRARRSLEQVEKLEQRSTTVRGDLFRGRSRRLLETNARARAGALVKGRRFLEEALAIDPALDEARIYLGFGLLVSGRVDRARAEFRRVRREGRDPVLQLMALQWLGNLNVNTSRLDEAVSCYEQVVRADVARNEPRLFSSYLNLPVTLGKLGRWEEALNHFRALARLFPDRLAKAREMLDGMSAFRGLLANDSQLQRDLREELPCLFAAA